MIRIFLIEDHELVRTALAGLLAKHPDMEVIGHAGSGEEALPQLRRLKPDVVLCDLHLPGISGLEVTERIVRSGDPIRVLIVSVQEDGPLPQRLMAAGAAGYLSKGCPGEELLRAVREVSLGKRYLGSAVAQSMALGRLTTDGSPFDALSSREMEVAMLLTQGLRLSDIGKRLNLSPKTVATHKYRVFAKLGIADTVALAKLAMQHGLAEAIA